MRQKFPQGDLPHRNRKPPSENFSLIPERSGRSAYVSPVLTQPGFLNSSADPESEKESFLSHQQLLFSHQALRELLHNYLLSASFTPPAFAKNC